MRQLSASEAAIELTKIENRNRLYHATYIRELCRKGKLKATRLAQRNWIIQEVDLIAFAASHQYTLNSDARFNRFFNDLATTDKNNK